MKLPQLDKSNPRVINLMFKPEKTMCIGTRFESTGRIAFTKKELQDNLDKIHDNIKQEESKDVMDGDVLLTLKENEWIIRLLIIEKPMEYIPYILPIIRRTPLPPWSNTKYPLTRRY